MPVAREVQASLGSHGGRPGEQVEPLCCSVPRGLGLVPHLAVPWGRMAALARSHALAPAPASGEWGGWGLSGRVLGRLSAHTSHSPIAARSRAELPIPVYVAGSELTALGEALQGQNGELESQGSGEWEGWGQKSCLFPPRSSSGPAPRWSMAAE